MHAIKGARHHAACAGLLAVATITACAGSPTLGDAAMPSLAVNSGSYAVSSQGTAVFDNDTPGLFTIMVGCGVGLQQLVDTSWVRPAYLDGFVFGGDLCETGSHPLARGGTVQLSFVTPPVVGTYRVYYTAYSLPDGTPVTVFSPGFTVQQPSVR